MEATYQQVVFSPSATVAEANAMMATRTRGAAEREQDKGGADGAQQRLGGAASKGNFGAEECVGAVDAGQCRVWEDSKVRAIRIRLA